jgi:hypothetical protein
MRALKSRMGTDVRGENCKAMMAAMVEQRNKAIARAAEVALEIASRRSNMLRSLQGRTEQVAAMSAADVVLWDSGLCLASADVISKLPVEALSGLGVGLVRPSFDAAGCGHMATPNCSAALAEHRPRYSVLERTVALF